MAAFCPRHEYDWEQCTADCRDDRLELNKERRRRADALRHYFSKRNHGRVTTERSLICAWCDTPFTSTAYQQRFCKYACRRRAERQRDRISDLVIHSINCAWCQALFSTTRPTQRFCQRLCEQRAGRYKRTRLAREARMARAA